MFALSHRHIDQSSTKSYDLFKSTLIAPCMYSIVVCGCVECYPFFTSHSCILITQNEPSTTITTSNQSINFNLPPQERYLRPSTKDFRRLQKRSHNTILRGCNLSRRYQTYVGHKLHSSILDTYILYHLLQNSCSLAEIRTPFRG